MTQPRPRIVDTLNAFCKDSDAYLDRNSMLCCIAGTAGEPQISLPITGVVGLPVGLSLIGARGSDEMLIAFAQEVVRAVGA